MDVTGWLRDLGLDRYAEAFAENEIDGETLPALTGDDLKEIGVSPLGHRKKLLAAIAELTTEEPAVAEEEAAAPAGERRQVTVLFADIAGYTKLSSALGAEATHAMLNRYFEAVDSIVERYGGAVDKHMGDNVMALFGAPIAHDDDPLRAVRAALDIHERMTALADEAGHPLRAHIGVASGQVVASGTGSETHREYTVTGDSVNLASRLQDTAKPGETLISDALYRAVAEAVDCESLGDIAVKGIDAPVRAWRVGALRTADDGADRVAFVGRRAELTQFSGAAEACRANGAGQAIVVRAEAGMGKTRLVEEFTALAADQGYASHRGLVLDFGVGKGQDAIRTVVRSLLGIAPGGGKGLRQAAAVAAIGDGVIAADRRVFLNDLLDLAQPVADRAMYDAMDNTTRNDGKRAVVADLIRGASTTVPILVIVEDVHWADSLLLSHVAAMAEAVADCPALLVMTSRIEGDPLDAAWRAATGGCPLMTIDLGPLRRDEALTLAGAFIDATEKFAQDCIERAGGNPLFLEQLLRNAEERADDEVPASIQSLVLARMDRLAPADKRALQAASVIGQRFALDVLGHLLDDADYDCAGLIEHHLARPEGDDYLFAHALIRDGVYASLLKATRHELHERAAEWFADHDPVLRAQHLDRAENPSAATAYLEAARAQAALYHYDVALRLVRRGCELAEGTADAFVLTAYLGELLHDTGAVPESMSANRCALDLARDDTERCLAWIGLAAVMRLTNNYEDALALLEKAEPIAVADDLTLDLARLYHLRGNLYFPLGRVEACGEAHEKGLAHARQSGNAEAEARALGGMGDAAYMRGHMLTAHRNFSDCVALSRRQGFGRIEVAHQPMAGLTLMYANQFRASREATLAAADAAARVGHLRAELNAVACAFHAMIDLGEIDDADALMAHYNALIDRLGAQAWEQAALAVEATVQHIRGQHAQAIDTMRRALVRSRETTTEFYGPIILARIAEFTDDPTEREQALSEGEAMLEAGTIGHNYLSFFRHAVDACLKAGDWDRAERYADALEDYTCAEPLPWSDFFIARGRALVAHGRGGRDETTMQELKRLRDEAERVGLKPALPALDAALAEPD